MLGFLGALWTLNMAAGSKLLLDPNTLYVHPNSFTYFHFPTWDFCFYPVLSVADDFAVTRKKFFNAVVVLATRRVVSFRPQLRFSSVEVWSAMSHGAAHKISAFIKSQKHIGNNYQCSGSGVDEALPSARGWHLGELRATQRCLAQAARSWAEQAENEVLECDCNSVQPDWSSPGMPPNANLLMHSR